MKRNNKPVLAAAMVMLVAGQSYQVQAAGEAETRQYAYPGSSTGELNIPSQNTADNRRHRGQQYQEQQYQNRQRYGGYGYNRPGNVPPYYRDRNYRRGASSMPWESRRGGSRMPWQSRRGSRSAPWDSGRGDWMSKDKFSDAWDDMLNAPSDMGEMPGGWAAPSVSVPNPVDVGDEFEDAARDAPDQMRNVYDDNRRTNQSNRYR